MLDELQDKVREAFKAIPYPGDDNIVPQKPYLDIESDQVKEFFRGKDWKEITIHELKHNYVGDQSACLTFMTPEAFRYYLPAYMLICIQDYKEADKLYASVFYHLDREFLRKEVFKERFDSLSDNTKKTIAEFIWAMHVLHGSEVSGRELRAFASYWQQYYTPRAT